jgi:8-oxo-dGTP diphosphatase
MEFQQLSAEELRKHKGTSFVGVTTCFFCYDKDGQVFMSKRSQKTRDEQGRWDFGGGGLKWGVFALENVKREVEEEYGAKALKVDFMGYRDLMRQLDDGTKTHWVALDFAVLVNHDDMKINEPDMMDDAGWFDIDNLPEPLHSQITIFVDKNKEQIQKLFRNQ